MTAIGLLQLNAPGRKRITQCLPTRSVVVVVLRYSSDLHRMIITSWLNAMCNRFFYSSFMIVLAICKLQQRCHFKVTAAKLPAVHLRGK